MLVTLIRLSQIDRDAYVACDTSVSQNPNALYILSFSHSPALPHSFLPFHSFNTEPPSQPLKHTNLSPKLLHMKFCHIKPPIHVRTPLSLFSKFTHYHLAKHLHLRPSSTSSGQSLYQTWPNTALITPPTIFGPPSCYSLHMTS